MTTTGVSSLDDMVSCPGELDMASSLCDDNEQSLENITIKPLKSPEPQNNDYEEEEDDGAEAKDTCKLTKSKAEPHNELGRTTTIEKSQTGRVCIISFDLFTAFHSFFLHFILCYQLVCSFIH